MNYLDLSRKALAERRPSQPEQMPKRETSHEKNEENEQALTPPNPKAAPGDVLPWDQAEAKRLVAEAIARHQATGWPDDETDCRRRGEWMDAIDDADLDRDLARLRSAVTFFLRAVPLASTVAPLDGDGEYKGIVS